MPPDPKQEVLTVRFCYDVPAAPGKADEKIRHAELGVRMKMYFWFLNDERAALRCPQAFYKNRERLTDAKPNVGKVRPSARVRIFQPDFERCVRTSRFAGMEEFAHAPPSSATD